MPFGLTLDELRAYGFQLARLVIVVYVISLCYRLVNRLIFTYRIRTRYTTLPCLPRHRLWGNLVDVGARLSPKINQHPDYAFEEVWKELGQPPAYIVDLAPVDRAMLIIADPGISEAIAQPSAEHKYSLPKSNTLQSLTTLVGDHSLVLIEGDHWKTQRRRFNKGFAPAHLHTLVPLVVSKTQIFMTRLKGYARSGESFALKEPSSDLTTDVITQVAINKDFHAQTTDEGYGAKSRFGILTSIKTMSSLTEKVGQGFNLNAYSPSRWVKEKVYDRLYTKEVYDQIVKNLGSKSESAYENGNVGELASAKAIVNLALAGLQPTPAVLEATVSQVKTFLFAGQDTTSTLIQWMAYELSKAFPSSPLYSEHHREIREKLCAELDTVFGKTDPLTFLSDPETNVDEILGMKLPYTTAFVKETLRLHPPGSSARLVPLAPYDPDYPEAKNSKPYFIDVPAWTHSRTGERHEAHKVQVDGCRLYLSHFLTHRNPAIWGPDVNDFEPARFLDRSGKGVVDENEEAMKTQSAKTVSSSATDAAARGNLPHPHHISTLPQGSFRPFERGPRNCIGVNLAYMEAKIVLAVIARDFEWTKVGLDGTRPKPGEVQYEGTGMEDFELGERRGWNVWSINNVTSVPVDGMRMRVKLVS